MSQNKRKLRRSLPKAPTGIEGLDEVTGGGLPRSRTTLVCGSAGCGKTLFGVEFLVRGALRYSEPGVCLAFDEAAEKLALNVRSLGFDLREFAKRKKLLVDHIRVERSEIEEAGEYNLDVLFIRLAHAVRTIHAKRVVLDGVDSRLAGLSNEAILRRNSGGCSAGLTSRISLPSLPQNVETERSRDRAWRNTSQIVSFCWTIA
jgi:circadian clock protein KaiC